MPSRRRPGQTSVILDAEQKRQLEQLARKIQFERAVRVTLSDVLRDAIALYLEHPRDARLQRLAEEKTEYDADATPSP